MPLTCSKSFNGSLLRPDNAVPEGSPTPSCPLALPFQGPSPPPLLATEFLTLSFIPSVRFSHPGSAKLPGCFKPSFPGQVPQEFAGLGRILASPLSSFPSVSCSEDHETGEKSTGAPVYQAGTGAEYRFAVVISPVVYALCPFSFGSTEYKYRCTSNFFLAASILNE